MNIYKKFAAVAAISLWCVPAIAATKIVNMDEIPYDLEVNISGEESTITINAGSSWETSGNNIRVKMGDKWKNLEADAEYDIWKGGKLVLQARKNVPGGRN